MKLEDLRSRLKKNTDCTCKHITGHYADALRRTEGTHHHSVCPKRSKHTVCSCSNKLGLARRLFGNHHQSDCPMWRNESNASRRKSRKKRRAKKGFDSNGKEI